MLIRCFQVMSHAKPLFFQDYSVKTLEVKGDYEIWAHDIQEYFNVSGYPRSFEEITNHFVPRPDAENPPVEVDYKNSQQKNQKSRTLAGSSETCHLPQPCDSIKRKLPSKYETRQVHDLWLSVRYCFFVNSEATIQSLRGEYHELRH